MSQAPSSTGLHLLFTVQSLACALPIERVVETMRPQPVGRVEHAPEVVLGLAVVRGVPTPVVDATRLLGAAGVAPPGRFLTLDVGGRPVSLAVTRVDGVRALGGQSFSSLPPLIASADAAAIAAIGVLDHELIVLLEGARLVPAAALAALSAGPEA